MPKRQVILLVLMGLALAYAAYELLLAGPSKAASAPNSAVSADLDSMVTTVKAAMDKGRMTELETYRLSRVDEKLFADPFLRNEDDGDGQAVAATVTTEADGARFSFSGLISMGKHSLAIINDSEYKTGDIVAETGFTLMDIRSEAVVLQGYNEESGALENVVVPIQDDFINFVEGDDEKE